MITLIDQVHMHTLVGRLMPFGDSVHRYIPIGSKCPDSCGSFASKGAFTPLTMGISRVGSYLSRLEAWDTRRILLERENRLYLRSSPAYLVI